MHATRIIAIRHGETTWNVDGRIQGHLDIPLNDTGLFPSEPLAESAVNLMTESGAMPGLEGAMAEYFAENPAEDLTDPEAEAALIPSNAENKGISTDT